jgi:hypothetical protein
MIREVVERQAAIASGGEPVPTGAATTQQARLLASGTDFSVEGD